MASASVNGVAAGPAAAAGDGVDGTTLPRIHDALRLIYNPHSSNQARQEAQAFLESVKTVDQAPSIGFELASAQSNSPIVRHYGLSLLEDAIKHKWATYTEEQAGYLRNWVLQLADKVSRDDPLFLRNKVALLWVEVAKRCWVGEWMDMDEMLMRLWRVPGPTVHKELVLYILETLSDEVFSGDDAVVALRDGVLSKACVDIFTPAAVLAEAFPSRQAGPDVRSGDEGWLNRVADLLQDCLTGDIKNDEAVRTCAVRSLAVLYSLMPWAVPKAIIASGCVPSMCSGLAASHVAVQKVRLLTLPGTLVTALTGLGCARGTPRPLFEKSLCRR